MAVTYGFYNALNHDRLYDAIQMSSIFDGIIRDGIFSTIGTSMTVTAPEDGLYVNVGPGRAWFNHTWTLNDTEYPVEAEEAEVVLDRIDAVILEVNSAAEVRANSIKFLKGTPASEPVKPTLTHNAEVNQYALAYVRIRAGQSTIFQADVENAVGTEETPFVTGLMQQVSIENLILQWEAEFDDHFENWRNVNEAEFEVWSSDMQDEYNRWILNQVNTYQTWFAGIQAEAGDDIDEVMAWFEHMKDQISEDAAIRLQEEIDALALSAEKGSVVTVHTINQTLYGKNCVISQDGQSRTARFDNTGTAVFESIPYVGQVTVTATDGTLTAVTYLTIPYFGRYSTNLAFWAATVELSTTSPEFFSLPIKIFKDNVLIETISFSALGAATYIATSEGTYKFSVTYDNADFDHTIEIDEETTYTVVINDWNATLNMQTSVSELYGRGITISKGGVTVGTTTFNGSGRATYKVHEPGTYHIVTSTAGGDTYQADVVVTEETAYSIDLGLPNGRTVLPTDDIQTWLHCAGINDKGYTTLAEVLEDSVTFNALLGDSNACDYMARSTTWAGTGAGLVPVMTGDTTPNVGITDDATAMSLLGRYDYACEAVLANEDWAEAIVNSEYFESVLDKKVPKMTSNTAPEGTCFATSVRDSFAAYMAFTGNTGDPTGLNAAYNVATWGVGYEFPEPVKIYRVQAGYSTSNLGGFSNWRIQYSDDGINWEYASSDPLVINSAVTDVAYMPIFVEDAHKYWRLYAPSTSGWTAIRLINFIGRHSSQNLVPLVPTMTSNTTPSGVADQSSSLSVNYYAWTSFNPSNTTGWIPATSEDGGTPWISYQFANPVVVKAIDVFGKGFSSSSPVITGKFQGSNDGTNWTDLANNIQVTNNTITYHLDNDTAYTRYRVQYTSVASGGTYNVGHGLNLQFYSSPTSFLHSVPNDTVYYLENGVETTLCTCDSNGVGEVDWSELPQGVMTLYSTTAKDILNNHASNDFSMNIRVTPNKVDAWLIPENDNIVYWFGYTKNSLGAKVSTSLNTNTITVSGGGSCAFDKAFDASKFTKMCMYGTGGNYGAHWCMGLAFTSPTSVSSSTRVGGGVSITDELKIHTQTISTTGNVYLGTYVEPNAPTEVIYALWAEEAA